MEGFAAQGGGTNLKFESGRVRFEINLDAAEHNSFESALGF
jgi:hypothetical protein